MVKYCRSEILKPDGGITHHSFIGVAPDNLAHCPDEASELPEAAVPPTRPAEHQIQHLQPGEPQRFQPRIDQGTLGLGPLVSNLRRFIVEGAFYIPSNQYALVDAGRTLNSAQSAPFRETLSEFASFPGEKQVANRGLSQLKTK